MSQAVSPLSPQNKQTQKAISSVDEALFRAQMKVRNVDMIVSVFLFLSGALLFFLAVAVLDHWIMPGGFNIFFRVILWLSGIGGLYSFIRWRIFPFIFYRVHPLYAAAIIEENVPGMKNSLVNLIFLRREMSQKKGNKKEDLQILNRKVLSSLEMQAASQVRHVDMGATVDHHSVIKFASIFVCVFAVFCLYFTLSPKDTFASIKRVLFPWAKIAVPTRVVFYEIHPGNSTIFQGESVLISAGVRNLSEEEGVTLFYSTRDGQIRDFPLEMRREGNSSRFQLLLTEENIYPNISQMDLTHKGIQQELSWFLKAGDCTSATFHVYVKPALTATVKEVTLSPPEYTGISSWSQKMGDIKAPVNTQVKMIVEVSQPVNETQLVLHSSLANKKEKIIRMKPLLGQDTEQSRLLEGNFSLKMAEKYSSFPEFDAYEIRLCTQENIWSEDGVKYRIQVIPDVHPEIRLLDAPWDGDELPVNQELSLRLEVEDPDYGLRGVAFYAQWNGKLLNIPPVLNIPLSEPALKKTFRITWKWLPEEYRLRSGDEILWWIEAVDNAHPRANRVGTEKRVLKIVESQNDEKNIQELSPEKRSDEESDVSLAPHKKEGKKKENHEKKPTFGENMESGDSFPETRAEENVAENLNSGHDQKVSGRQTDARDSSSGESSHSRDQADISPSPPQEKGSSEESLTENLNDDVSKNKEEDAADAHSKTDDARKGKDVRGDKKDGGEEGGRSDVKNEKSSGDSSVSKEKEEGGKNTAQAAKNENSETGSGKRKENRKASHKSETGKNKDSSENRSDGKGTSDEINSDKAKSDGGGQEHSRKDTPLLAPDDYDPLAPRKNMPKNEEVSSDEQKSRNPGSSEKHSENRKEHTSETLNSGERERPELENKSEEPQNKSGNESGMESRDSSGKNDAETEKGSKKNKSGNDSDENLLEGNAEEENGNDIKNESDSHGEEDPGRSGDSEDARGDAGESASSDSSSHAGTEDSPKKKQSGETKNSDDKNFPGSTSEFEKGAQAEDGQTEKTVKNGLDPGESIKFDPQVDPGSAFEEIMRHYSENAENENGETESDSGQDQQPVTAESEREGTAAEGSLQKADRPQEAPPQDAKETESGTGEESARQERGADRSGNEEPEKAEEKIYGGNRKGGSGESDQSGIGRPGESTVSNEGNAQGSGDEENSVGEKGGQGNITTKNTGVPDSHGRSGKGSTTKQNHSGNRENKNAGKDTTSSAEQKNRLSDSQKNNSDQKGMPQKSSSEERGQSAMKGMGSVPGKESPGNASSREALAADAANMEFARQQTILALRHLSEEIRKNDSALLKNLGWSREEAEAFYEKWNSLHQNAQKRSKTQKESQEILERSLRNLGLQPGSVTFSAENYKEERRPTVRDSIRIPPPPEWAGQYEAYSKSVAEGLPEE
ncbi:MAG: hypothetical protein Q4C96_08125 [Planctomycetia bacterium]|nr:hypothetical protein [Planctomycetia bacterium]